MHNRCEKVSIAFRDMVRAPLEHKEYRGHHIMGEPLTSRHDSRRNHHIMVLVRTAGLALRERNVPTVTETNVKLSSQLWPMSSTSKQDVGRQTIRRSTCSG